MVSFTDEREAQGVAGEPSGTSQYGEELAERFIATSDRSKVDRENLVEAMTLVLGDDQMAKQFKTVLDLQAHSQKINARKVMTWRLTWLVFAWLIAVVGIVVLAGWRTGPQGLAGDDGEVAAPEKFLVLSDTVLVAMLGTTTINVIGLLVIVVKFLFPVGEKTPEWTSSTAGRPGTTPNP